MTKPRHGRPVGTSPSRRGAGSDTRPGFYAVSKKRSLAVGLVVLLALPVVTLAGSDGGKGDESSGAAPIEEEARSGDN